MRVLLLSAAQEGVTKAVEPALSTLSQTIIGALLVVSWGITILAVWQLVKVQNARIADKERDSARIEGLNERLITVFSDFKNSLDNLTAAEKEGQQLLTSIKQSLDTVILTAVQGRGSLRPRSRGEGGG